MSPCIHRKMNFAGKVILITGASAGIGAEAAEHFARLGASVALVGRNQENLAAVVNSIQTNHVQAKLLSIVADVTKDTERIVHSTIEHFGKLDVLVNNAGISGHNSIEKCTLDEYDTTMNTNLRSVYHLTMLAVPHLIQTKGNIINVSSLAGLRSFPNVLVYCMSKAALDQFTKCIALELAPKGVRVNSVNPAVIVTNFHTSSGMSTEVYQKYLEETSKSHPLGRVGQPQEVAAAITFLASDSASFITGTLLPVDSGRHNMCPR